MTKDFILLIMRTDEPVSFLFFRDFRINGKDFTIEENRSQSTVYCAVLLKDVWPFFHRNIYPLKEALYMSFLRLSFSKEMYRHDFILIRYDTESSWHSGRSSGCLTFA